MNHPCVKGFGIDVEWLNAQDYSEGQHVTDSMAQHWEQSVKSINSDYTLFLKHYSKNWMPSVYRGEILFVDDSQDFPSLNSMVSEFFDWGTFFSSNKVAFQYGYPIDDPWWSQYADPMLTIGNALKGDIENCYGLFWVDFTICDVFPVNTNITEYSDKNEPFIIYSINPNPFRTSVTIELELLMDINLYVKIFNIKGEKIKVIEDDINHKGKYNITVSSENMKQGTYYCIISAGNYEKKIELSVIK
ncbi:MAG: T9SS type A sorting domain-containing protein [Bacteroidia bacterium]|nr:T9SS type A sorting domain-containing protein [Bacteroidia bacterium]